MIDNLYQHADGGYYCLMLEDVPMKYGEEWIPGVVYVGTDGQFRSTTLSRWKERFAPVAEYTDADVSVLDMIRRTNPGEQDFDFMQVFETWSESEINLAGQMLELAVAAALDRCADGKFTMYMDAEGYEITIMTADLQRVWQTYDIEKVAIEHGFIFSMHRK